MSQSPAEPVTDGRQSRFVFQNTSTGYDYLNPHVVVDLTVGAPGERQLKRCAEVMKTATVHRMEQPDSHLLLQYGPEAGDRKFLKTLGTFLTEEYQSPVDSDDLVATAGASHGLGLLAHLLFSPGDLVFMETPTYYAAIMKFKNDVGLQIKDVPVDESGIIVEELEKALKACQSHRPRDITERKPFWSMLYLVSTFHNPTGACLSPDRCRKVVELARKYNLLVVCDDVYNLLYFPSNSDKPDLTRLFAYDDKNDPAYQGNVVSNGSFSKIFCPGIRLGWMEASERIVDFIIATGVAASGGGFNHTTSGLMTSVISLGFLKEILMNGRKMNQERALAVCDVLHNKLPCAMFRQPKGGYFIWVKLPETVTVNTTELTKLCKEKVQVAVQPGEYCSPSGGFTNYMRICFTFYEKEVLVSAVEKVAKIINELMAGGSK